MTLTRLLTEPHAVAQEAGINIPTDTTINTVVVGSGAGETPAAIVVVHLGDGGWIGLIIVNGQVVGEIEGPVLVK